MTKTNSSDNESVPCQRCAKPAVTHAYNRAIGELEALCDGCAARVTGTTQGALANIEITRTWPEAAWAFPALPADADNADIRFEIEHYPGPFASVRSVRALVVVDTAFDTEHYSTYPSPIRRRVIGVRTLTNVHEDGYQLVGRVSVNGRKRRAFTSGMIVTDAAGKLRKVAILYVSLPERKTFVTEG